MDGIDGYIKAHAPKAAVVMGGGFVGLEMAEAFAKRGLRTTVVEFLPTVMAAMDAGFGRRVAGELRANGVEVRVALVRGSLALCCVYIRLCSRSRAAALPPPQINPKQVRTGVGVTAYHPETQEVELSDGSRVPAGIVLVSVGVRPELDLARKCGECVYVVVGGWEEDVPNPLCPLFYPSSFINRQTKPITARTPGVAISDKTGAVPVDEHLRTSDPSIFAAGDMVEVCHKVSGRQVRSVGCLSVPVHVAARDRAVHSTCAHTHIHMHQQNRSAWASRGRPTAKGASRAPMPWGSTSATRACSGPGTVRLRVYVYLCVCWHVVVIVMSREKTASRLTPTYPHTSQPNNGSVCQIFGATVASTGLSEKAARDAGFKVGVAEIVKEHHAGACMGFVCLVHGTPPSIVSIHLTHTQ